MNKKYLLVITIIFIIWVISKSKSTFGESSSMDVLFEDNDITKSGSLGGTGSKDVVFIIYAPWCGHCKRSMPEFRKASETSDNIVLVNSEDPSNKDIMSKYSVRSFPTIIKSDGTAYMGDRTSDKIIDFAMK